VLKPDTSIDVPVYVCPHNSFDMKFNPELWNQRPEKKGDGGKESEAMRVHIESKPMGWTWEQIVHESEESKSLLHTCSWGSKYHN
jgi:hypothetical protein